MVEDSDSDVSEGSVPGDLSGHVCVPVSHVDFGLAPSVGFLLYVLARRRFGPAEAGLFRIVHRQRTATAPNQALSPRPPAPNPETLPQ